MAEENTKEVQAENQEIKKYFGARGVEQLSKVFSKKGIEEKISLQISSAVVHQFDDSKINDIVKLFQESKDAKAYIGMTMVEESEDDEDEKPHDHTYALLSLNWGAQIVGVTTSTKKAKDHVHIIDIDIDCKIKSLSGYTDYSYISISDNDYNDLHRHLVDIDVYALREQIPTVISTDYYYSERDKNDNKQYTVVGRFGEREVKYSSQRQAEILLAEISQFKDNPKWNKESLESLKIATFNSVFSNHPDSIILNDSRISEIAEISSMVKNKGNVIFSANNANVADNKIHFPINSTSQARSALSRIAQYSEVPSWYKGTLKELKEQVRDTVKKEYPSAYTALSDFYSVRIKGEADAFFINCSTSDVDMAKSDANIYMSEYSNYRVDLVKFSVDKNGESKFSEVGKFLFYDSKTKGLIKASGDSEIRLSEKDKKGNNVIEILRTGSYNHPEYGRFEVTTNTFSDIIKNFNRGVLDREISFDFEHMPQLPAAAWCKDLSTTRRSIKGNMQDVLLAHVKFTPKGEEAVKNGEFRYFSSEYVDNFIDKETSDEFGTTLRGGGLTNRPWIPGLKPIELSEKSNQIAFIKSN